MKYELTLVASDSLNESVTKVVILIKDSNDLPPVFNQTVYAAYTLEELAEPLPNKLLQVAQERPPNHHHHHLLLLLLLTTSTAHHLLKENI